MTRVAEKLVIMDAATTFGSQKRISVSRNFGLFLLIVFVCCIVATGLLVYSLSGCSYSEKEIVFVRECNFTQAIQNSSPNPSTEFSEDATTEFITTTLETPKTETLDLRLPKSVLPHSYKLKLIPFIYEGNFTFHGDVQILVNVTKETNSITMHAINLTIDDSSVRVYESSEYFNEYREISVLEVGNDTKRQFLIIHLEEVLEPGKQYSINISFQGVLNDELDGFYRSSYTDNNETRWLASTQFQSTDARKAFPCFDEPSLKARFTLSLARPRNMTTISNMPKMGVPIEVTGIDGYVWDHFQESLPMSTYLLAFVVSDFEYIRKDKFSIWARHSAVSQSTYALDIGPKFLEFFEGFFNIPFPLPKMDMVAVPDFSSGAMENWGLVTYRESLLLYQEGVSNRKSLQSIATVVAHELAHQWFGNLVTPSWWTDLWLNEGFATYMENVATDYVYPEWKIMDQFIINELQSVFFVDALENSHQISIVINNTDEIDDIFDRISYSKSATIIRMMENFLTRKVFQAGLTKYLNKRAYSSATQDDLWEMLNGQAILDGVLTGEFSVKEIMDTWTLQTGFPVVVVERGYDTYSIQLQQERYLRKRTSYSKETWWIPVTYKGKTGNVKSIWMKPSEKHVILTDVQTAFDEWLLVNVNQTGYYRVNYDTKNWKLLTDQLVKPNGHLEFDPKNRAQMLDDSFNLAAAGYLDYDIPFNISRYVVQERDYVPWRAAFTAFDYINSMFVWTQHYDKFKAYVSKLIEGVYRDIGFQDNPGDSQLTVYLRAEVLWRACTIGVVDCLVNAVSQFENWRNTPNPDKNNPISPNLREIVYYAAIRVGGQEQWDFAWERYLNANVGSEREILMTALGCTREIWILSRYLEWAVADDSPIRRQDIARVFTSISENVVGRDLAYRFLKNTWKKKSYVRNAQISSSIIRACTRKFNTRQELNDLKQFIASIESDLGSVRTGQQSIERVEANIEWMDKNYNKIVNWLSKI